MASGLCKKLLSSLMAQSSCGQWTVCLHPTFPAELVPLGCLVNAGLRSYRQDVGWSYLIRSTLNNYQSWFVLLIIILATGAAVLVGKYF